MPHTITSADYYPIFEKVAPLEYLSSCSWIAIGSVWAKTCASWQVGKYKTQLSRVAQLSEELNDIGLGKRRHADLKRILIQSQNILLELNGQGFKAPLADWQGRLPDSEYGAHIALHVAFAINIQSKYLIDTKVSDVEMHSNEQDFRELASSALWVACYAACIDKRHAVSASLLRAQTRILYDGNGGTFGLAVQEDKLKTLERLTKEACQDSVELLPLDGLSYDRKVIWASAVLASSGILGLLVTGAFGILFAALFIAAVCSLTSLYLVHRARLLGLRAKIMFHLCGALVFVEGVYLAATLIFRELLS